MDDCEGVEKKPGNGEDEIIVSKAKNYEVPP